MGNDNSTPLPPPPADHLSYFTITFSGPELGLRDSLYLNYCRSSEIQLILEALKETYPPGIKFHKVMVEYGYRIKLNGVPFEEVTIGGRSESVWTRNFLASMFLKLGRKGWIPYMPSDLRRFGDTVSVFMAYRPEAAAAFLDTPAIAVVGLHNSDRIQLINIDGSLAQHLLDVVRTAWHKEVSMKEKETDAKSGHSPLAYQEMEMSGSPWGWMTGESDAVHGRLAVLRIIEAMAKRGWRMVLNCNVRPTTDTLFFVRDDKIALHVGEFGGGAVMFGMGLHKMDEFRIVGRRDMDDSWQPQVVDAVSRTISAFWPQGLKRSEQKDDFYVLEMHGTPWWADGTDAVQSRLMVAKVFETLISLGWLIKSTIDCSRKDNDKNSLFFERCQPISTSISVISFNESDKIRAINCPKELEDVLDQTITKMWEVQRKQPYGASQEWKLKGNPWDWGHWQNKALALYLLHALSSAGYTIMASADTSAKYVHQQNGPDYPMDVHSWYLAPTAVLEKIQLGSGAAMAGTMAASTYASLAPPSAPSMAHLGPPPPYSYVAPSPNVSPMHSRQPSPEPEEMLPPPYEPQGVPQWGASLYPRL